MRQIIPFKKELLFKTKVSEITSISLEHSISSKEDDKVVGNFLVTGDYKMTEGSINREKFRFDIPFEINLDDKYDMDSIIIDIDNFYYEVVNNESLKVNIDVYVMGDRIEEELPVEDNCLDNAKKDDTRLNDLISNSKDNELEEESIKYKKANKVESIVDEDDNIDINIDNSNNSINTNDNMNTNSIFNNIDTGDTYVTYYVYIVKEGDTLDKVLDKFKVSKEELEKYNDISDIKEKDKLIIPSSNNG